MFKKIHLVAILIGSAALSSLAQPANLIELPDSIWAGDSVKWERKVPYYCEGPAFDETTLGAGAGYVYFTQQIGNSTPNWPVWRIRPGSDTGSVWYNTYQNNGLQFDKQGRLIATQNGRLSRLTGMSPVPVAKSSGAGGPPDTATLVVSGNNGVTFNQANDLTIGTNGDIFFTALGSAVYYLKSGVLYTATNANATISQANGIERLESDTNSLYVNSSGGSGGNTVYKFTIGDNGSLSNKTSFITGITSPDGGTYDSHGNRYVASYSLGEIRVYSAAGSYLGRIAMRMQTGIYDSVASSGRIGNNGNASNCVFGGSDMKTLYITGDGGLYSIRLKIPGVPRQLTYTSIRRTNPRYDNLPQGETESRDLRGRMIPAASKVPAIKVPDRKQ